jgi:flagellar M-ring protein FliF
MALDTDTLKRRATEVLRGFSPSQIVIIGLLSVLGLTGAVFFLKWVSTPSYGVLLAGLDPKDAQAVTAKLTADGVTYKLEAGGSTVLVPQADIAKERIAVAAEGLPAGKTADGWAAFDKQGLTASSFQQQVAYQRAMEATLANSLADIEGVSEAQVHLALPEKKLFTENQDPARASVLVKSRGTLPDDTVSAITHLVASAVPGLSAKDVSITDGSGQLLTGSGDNSSSKADTARRAYEDSLSAQVTSMFDTLLGPGRAVVRVNASIDTSSTTIDSEVYDPTKTATLTQSASSEVYNPTPTATTAGGTVTTAPDQTTTGSETASGYTKDESASTQGVSKTVTHQEIAAGNIKRLTVTVAVDRNAKNLPPTADLQAMVASAVGLDTNRGDTLSVTTPAFLQDESTEAAGEAAASGGPLSLVQEQAPRAIGALLLLFVGFGFLRTIKKGAEITAAVASGKRGNKKAVAAPASRAALPAGTVPAQRPQSDLLGVLDENPDEVAGMLRGWMANVGGGDR